MTAIKLASTRLEIDLKLPYTCPERYHLGVVVLQYHESLEHSIAFEVHPDGEQGVLVVEVYILQLLPSTHTTQRRVGELLSDAGYAVEREDWTKVLHALSLERADAIIVGDDVPASSAAVPQLLFCAYGAHVQLSLTDSPVCI